MSPKESAEKAHRLVTDGQYLEAIPLLNDAIEHWDDDKDELESVFWDRGIALNCTGKHQEAISDFTEAIEIGGSGYLYHARGIALRRINDFSAALQDYKIANSKIPGDDWTVMFLSQLLSCSPNDTDRDGIYAKQLVEFIEENTPEKYDLLSCALAEMGKFDRAIELQNDILEFWQSEDDPMGKNGIDLATHRLEQFSDSIPIRLGVNDCDTWYQSFCQAPIQFD